MAELDLPLMSFSSQQAFEDWLAEQHTTSKGIWMKIARKAARIDSVSYPEAVESALCYGWIDGLKRPLDQQFWLQRFTPRGRKSIWSRINRDKALALIADGRMQPAGLEQVTRAQDDGRWAAAYDNQAQATVPPDLQAAMDAAPGSQAFFETLSGPNRYAVLFRIQTAKRPETRARRIQQFVEMLREQKKIYP